MLIIFSGDPKIKTETTPASEMGLLVWSGVIHQPTAISPQFTRFPLISLFSQEDITCQASDTKGTSYKKSPFDDECNGTESLF